MAKVLICKDVGVDCDWHACGKTDEDVLQQGAEHARNDHGMTEISDEMMVKVKAAIKEAPCPTGIHF